jgi:(5-formylfuran-3-yl)methyl phosphate synthase
VVPPEIPLSVALGDLATSVELHRALESLDLEARPGGTFVKLGFAGVDSDERIGELLKAAGASAATLRCRPRVVAVAYADHLRAGVPSPAEVARAAISAGASGVLLDTAVKDGRGLTHWMAAPALATWVADVRRAGLLSALAGGLGGDSLEPVLAARPDVSGVRGAACAGGRDGLVETAQVRGLITMLSNSRFAKRHVGVIAEARTGHSSY